MTRTMTAAVTVLSVLPLAVSGGESGPGGRPLAWIRFAKTEQRYNGTPYLWLGRYRLRAEIDVAPADGHVLDLRWGSKNDKRFAALEVNGKAVAAAAGGWDGFRWHRVALPDGLKGTKYTITLTQGGGKPAFINEIRLTDPAGDPLAPKQMAENPFRVALKKKPVAGGGGGGEAFPEKRAFWDTPAPPPEKPLDDPAREAVFRAAEKHGRQANEMFFRCRKLAEGWLACADPKTGLLPRRLGGKSRDIWNAKDCAADLYPFIVLTYAILDREMFTGRMREILETEKRLTCRIDRLPDTYSFSKGGFAAAKPNLGAIIFGGSEYVKDGLMPLTEWLGPSPWRDRMIGIVDDLWKHAPVDTPAGKIVSTNFEVNGEMMQVLSRLYWMTGDEKYLRWCVRLGDYYLLGDRHPTRDMKRLSLDDHGCEAISGLCELYAALSFADKEKKRAYRAPLYAMLDRILATGRTEHGLFYNRIDNTTGTASGGLTDNWGYDLNGYYTVFLVDGTDAYRRAVLKALGSLRDHYIDYRWEGGGADGYADSVEGGINLYNREPVPSALEWIDSEIHDMWRKQRPDGVVEGWYGDGNSARTGIMYALMKTRGVTARPWRTDLRFGAAVYGDELLISVIAGEAWDGALLFDRPRHADYLNLPLDYPRINQFPEWFTAAAGKTYTVENLTTGIKARYDGAKLIAGIPLSLQPGRETRIVVTPVE